uniref:Uncharacterized protein n=1 Tax=viral metagenome TaxID=1070528 RepID=A0A6M3L1C5_9ZZZZ
MKEQTKQETHNRNVKGFNEMDTISLMGRADAFAQGRWFQRNVDEGEIKSLRSRLFLM